AEDRPADAVALLDAPNLQPLPPRGLALRAQALAASGHPGEAYGLLGPLRQQNALPPARLDGLEARWAEASLREAGDANMLADRWEALPKPLRSHPAAVAAYAERAAALRWEDAAASSIEHALDTRWDEVLAGLYGRLPIGRMDARRGRAERWLQDHPASPGLLLTLARLSRAQGQWPQSEGYLHRALAQGANAEAWEELGHGFAQAGDESRARLSYANALRASRNEPITELPGRDLRERIYDEAVHEERDEHGMPRLRGWRLGTRSRGYSARSVGWGRCCRPQSRRRARRTPNPPRPRSRTTTVRSATAPRTWPRHYRPRTRWCSRCPRPVLPSGTSPIRPGSSTGSCCPTGLAHRRSTPAGTTCSTATTAASATPTRRHAAGCCRVRRWRRCTTTACRSTSGCWHCWRARPTR